jgi:hypothetical protein
MANLYLCDLDLNKNELQNAVVQNLGTAPGTPKEGQIYYDTGDDTIYFRNASAWVDLGQQGDITSVIAGAGMTGGGTSGDVTLNVIGGTGITVNAGNIALTNGLIANGSNITSVGTIGTGIWQGTTIKTAYIGDNQVTEDKLADTLLAEIDANTAKDTNATHSGEVTGSGALTIADNIVDEANLKVSNAPTNGQFLSAQSGNTGGLTWAAIPNLTGHITSSGNDTVLGSFTVAQLSAAISNASISGNNTGDQTTVSGSSGTVTSIGNLTGEVTSVNRATTIVDNIVDEANLKVSNGPTDGSYLTAQSANAGGLTWAALPAVDDVSVAKSKNSFSWWFWF